MKLHADPPTDRNTVTAYGPGYVEINKVRHERAVVLTPDRPISPWNVASFDALRAEDFAALLSFAPDVVLLGTGARQRFPHPRLLAPLARARIGLEVMDTQAACRTYNILMAEGRRVLAALLLEP
ncbi:MAG TPA: Mth938-like domain-containing protein [Burkholderiaceae bacterium]|nr:Mth938-like domain-containing protein [Burkholderiaceae bacterium]